MTLDEQIALLESMFVLAESEAEVKKLQTSIDLLRSFKTFDTYAVN